MFSDPKKHPEEDGVAKKSVKKMDTLVTGMILGGIIASIYGVKKFTEKPESNDHTHMLPKNNEQSDRTDSVVKKKGILSRIFFGNK